MPVIFDTGALVRPAFDPSEFTATKWETGTDKAGFANGLCRFIAADFKFTLFTGKLYRRLASTFGHIACYNKHGFITEFFMDLRGKIHFVEQTTMWRPCGDPAWTYSDVERAVLKRLRACDLLTAYCALRAAEVDGAERELRGRPQTKHADKTTPTQAPIRHRPPPLRTDHSSRDTSEQRSLF